MVWVYSQLRVGGSALVADTQFSLRSYSLCVTALWAGLHLFSRSYVFQSFPFLIIVFCALLHSMLWLFPSPGLPWCSLEVLLWLIHLCLPSIVQHELLVISSILQA